MLKKQVYNIPNHTPQFKGWDLLSGEIILEWQSKMSKIYLSTAFPAPYNLYLYTTCPSPVLMSGMFDNDNVEHIIDLISSHAELNSPSFPYHHPFSLIDLFPSNFMLWSTCSLCSLFEWHKLTCTYYKSGTTNYTCCITTSLYKSPSVWQHFTK